MTSISRMRGLLAQASSSSLFHVARIVRSSAQFLSQTFSTVVVHSTPIAAAVAESLARLSSAGASHAVRIARPSAQSLAQAFSTGAVHVGRIARSSAQVSSARASRAGQIVLSRGQSLAPILFAVPVPDPSKPSIRIPARLGNALILLFVIVFGGWGWLVPLDGGAVAPGVVNPDSGKKTVQHLEGGIIAELRVHEGDAVKAGQPLVVLESTQARAAHETLVQQRLSLLARKARLDAERAGQSRIDLPAELRSADPQIRRIVDAQQEMFDTRRSTHSSRRDILAQRIEQLLHQIKGAEAQVESATKQLDLVGIWSRAACRPNRKCSGCSAPMPRFRESAASMWPRSRGHGSRSAKPGCNSSRSTRSGPIRSPPTPRSSAPNWRR